MRRFIRTILFVALLFIANIFLNCSQVNSQKPFQIRCVTYNIYHGEDMNGESNLTAVASILDSVSADLVALQEVDKNVNRSHNIDIAAELGRLTGMHSFFGKAMDYDGGEYGEAILSRFPILDSANYALPHSPGHEPRAAISVVVELPNGEKIRFMGTHLDHPKNSPDRVKQAVRINEIVEHDSLPVILAGDLNDTQKSESIKILKSRWTDAAKNNAEATYPSVNPERRIDYIMVLPENRWRMVESRVLAEKAASDHRPVLTVLDLLPKASR